MPESKRLHDVEVSELGTITLIWRLSEDRLTLAVTSGGFRSKVAPRVEAEHEPARQKVSATPEQAHVFAERWKTAGQAPWTVAETYAVLREVGVASV